jgi:hypothetical protein
LKRSGASFQAPRHSAWAGRFRGLGLDFIVKYSVFRTLAGFARLKNSAAVFQVI